MFLEAVRKVKKIEHPNWNPSRDEPKNIRNLFIFQSLRIFPPKNREYEPIFS